MLKNNSSILLFRLTHSKRQNMAKFLKLALALIITSQVAVQDSGQITEGGNNNELAKGRIAIDVLSKNNVKMKIYPFFYKSPEDGLVPVFRNWDDGYTIVSEDKPNDKEDNNTTSEVEEVTYSVSTEDPEVERDNTAPPQADIDSLDSIIIQGSGDLEVSEMSQSYETSDATLNRTTGRTAKQDTMTGHLEIGSGYEISSSEDIKQPGNEEQDKIWVWYEEINGDEGIVNANKSLDSPGVTTNTSKGFLNSTITNYTSSEKLVDDMLSLFTDMAHSPNETENEMAAMLVLRNGTDVFDYAEESLVNTSWNASFVGIETKSLTNNTGEENIKYFSDESLSQLLEAGNTSDEMIENTNKTLQSLWNGMDEVVKNDSWSNNLVQNEIEIITNDSDKENVYTQNDVVVNFVVTNPDYLTDDLISDEVITEAETEMPAAENISAFARNDTEENNSLFSLERDGTQKGSNESFIIEFTTNRTDDSIHFVQTANKNIEEETLDESENSDEQLRSQIHGSTTEQTDNEKNSHTSVYNHGTTSEKSNESLHQINVTKRGSQPDKAEESTTAATKSSQSNLASSKSYDLWLTNVFSKNSKASSQMEPTEGTKTEGDARNLKSVPDMTNPEETWWWIMNNVLYPQSS